MQSVKCRDSRYVTIMYWYVVIVLILVVVQTIALPSPLRVTIDCSSEERESYGRPNLRSKSSKFDQNYKTNTFCDLIHSAIPSAVKDGRFVLIQPDEDQTGYSDTPVPMSVSPPKGFIPSITRFKVPKLKVPKFNVPKLRAQNNQFTAPSIGTPRPFTILMDPEDESSAERMEKFKKGVKKLLHVVKVLGKIDDYLSERTRIVIDKLTKTFAE